MKLSASTSIIILLLSPTASGFNIPNPFAGLMKAPTDGNPLLNNNNSPNSNSVLLKPQLLEAISSTNNGKDADLDTQKRVLQLVRKLETERPVPDTILTDPKEAKRLDGVWFLQYTSPSELGEEEDIDTWTPENPESKIDTKPYNNKGTVGAVGIKVETANRVTKQIFDVANSKVANSVEQDFGIIHVGGSFRPSDSVPNRAIAAFEDCWIEFNNGFQLDLGFVFSIIGAVRGTKDNGWLETTYLDNDMRIGRGNKGSLFVLTRDQNAVQP
eukprot:CAMPEP_0117055896 /NCGR_PEP_ID=MMETSP0472-20121206/38770_1 /TAXON_ID=693140 ORGANISM="Tiarina fusus, Strain LIS" /NCGR_SAMPLE_ID=MMETSP0472 /ASSEMBLY_ACC=CAM_ASM_000603 /LENGTH=270 /DNA_ID=CAMNT_0004772111 /DNA_START=50 /DNA_END=862 /DNA_ORIENTATION=-